MRPIDSFYRAALAYPDRSAVVDSSGASYTYGKLLNYVDHVAREMQKISSDDYGRVVMVAGNSADYIVGLLSLMAANKCWIPLHHNSKLNEIDNVVDLVKPEFLLTDSRQRDLLLQDKPRVVDLKKLIDSVDVDTVGIKPVCSAYDAETTQAIKFTGGTTGTPKGVMQPFRAWNITIENQVFAWELSETSRFVLCTPISHGAGTYVLPVLAQGGCLIVCSSASESELKWAFGPAKANITFMPPTLIHTIIKSGQYTKDDFQELETLIYGSAPMLVTQIKEAQDFFGNIIATTYGQTEAPTIATYLSAQEMADPELTASVGRAALGVQVRISKDRQDSSSHGEILIKGELVMNGYYAMKEETNKTIKNGWLHTGDVGYINDDGYVFIKDRIKDVVITGGFNVYPSEVENVLLTNPSVKEAAVFGLPDDKWGEIVSAAIVLGEGKDVSAEELIDYVKQQLGSVKAPKKVLFFDEELPKSKIGKIAKKDVIAKIAGV